MTLDVITLALWAAFLPMFAAAQSQGVARTVSCNQAFSSAPHVGEAFRGVVQNSDYHFVAHVPPGLTGWTGTGESAPFHGFAIFLADDRRSCIVFEIHVRVDQSDAPKRPIDAKPIVLGHARGWEIETAAKEDSEQFTNVRTVFSFRQRDQIDDGSVLLIAPAKRLPEAMAQYRAFLRGLEFGR